MHTYTLKKTTDIRIFHIFQGIISGLGKNTALYFETFVLVV